LGRIRCANSLYPVGISCKVTLDFSGTEGFLPQSS
jgi:hypothetical protein